MRVKLHGFVKLGPAGPRGSFHIPVTSRCAVRSAKLFDYDVEMIWSGSGSCSGHSAALCSVHSGDSSLTSRPVAVVAAADERGIGHVVCVGRMLCV